MSTSSLSSATPLSQKCSICLSTTPKYRCPRCQTRTCSLSCVRVHKSRSLCNGARDATTFLSRKDLSSEKAFDSDFNFLSAVERGVERAARTFADHEVIGEERKKESWLRKAIGEAGVVVLSAPKGVRRERENQSRVDSRRKFIIWTTEWKFLGRRVLNSVPEHLSLQEAHDVAILESYREETESGRKQKLAAYARSAGVVVPDGYQARKEIARELGLALATPKAQRQIDDKQKADRIEAKLSQAQKTAEDVSNIRDDSAPLGTAATLTPLKDDDCPEPEPESATATRIKSSKSQRQFHIHRPQLSSAQRQVLSPVSGQISLREVLRGKTVREFPTFIVSMSGMDELEPLAWHILPSVEGLMANPIESS